MIFFFIIMVDVVTVIISFIHMTYHSGLRITCITGRTSSRHCLSFHSIPAQGHIVKSINPGNITRGSFQTNRTNFFFFIIDSLFITPTKHLWYYIIIIIPRHNGRLNKGITKFDSQKSEINSPVLLKLILRCLDFIYIFEIRGRVI